MGEDRGGRERRKLKRIVRRIPVLFLSGGRNAEGYIKNLSKGGVFIRSDTLPEAGAPIKILIQPTQVQKIEVSGAVRWTTEQYPERSPQPGFGVMLDLPVPEDYMELFEYVMLN